MFKKNSDEYLSSLMGKTKKTERDIHVAIIYIAAIFETVIYYLLFYQITIR